MKKEERAAAESNRALEWLNSKWIGRRQCPICEHGSWTIAGVVEHRPYQGGNIVIGGGEGTFPAFQVVCTNCGYIFFVNAVLSGVVDPKEYEAG